MAARNFVPDLIEVPAYPPDPVEGGLHIWRMGASMISNPFRNVDDSYTLSALRLVSLTVTSAFRTTVIYPISYTV